LPSTKIVVATENEGKLQEIAAYLSAFPITLISQKSLGIPQIEETGLSFVENAILKARYVAKLSGLPTLADDSGLVVEALGGAPGIYSARYAGENKSDADNIEKLLTAMASFSGKAREAYFYCAMAFVQHALDPVPLICEGRWDGSLLTDPVGKNGFGYDPLFFIEDLQCSAAELAPAIKNKRSHRAQALALLSKHLPSLT